MGLLYGRTRALNIELAFDTSSFCFSWVHNHYDVDVHLFAENDELMSYSVHLKDLLIAGLRLHEEIQVVEHDDFAAMVEPHVLDVVLELLNGDAIIVEP